jgi:hypothetical protein
MTEEKVCGNCGRLESDHLKGKCLYTPTKFKHMRCVEILSYDPYSGQDPDYCNGAVMGINTPKMTEDAPTISWRCPDCGARGERSL